MKMNGFSRDAWSEVFTGAAASVLLLACDGPVPALATRSGALVRAYQNNPQLNAPARDGAVSPMKLPQALSGYRPKVAVTARRRYQYTETTLRRRSATSIVAYRNSQHQSARSVGATSRRPCSTPADRPTRPARPKARSRGAREALRVLEQPCCCRRPTIYMDYLRDPRSSRFRRATCVSPSRR